MSEFYEFIKSDLGVAISWIATIASTIITIATIKENNSLKAKIAITSSTTEHSQDSITQNGEKNIYTKNNSGDMNIKM